MKSQGKILVLISMFIILISCHKDHDSTNDSIFQTWEAKSFMSLESVAYPKIEGNRVLITFNQDGTYKLDLDVNHCLGSFTTGFNSQIEIGSAGCTKMCCDSEFSIKLVEMLPEITSFKIEGNSLQLNVPQWGWIECKRFE